MRVDKNRVEYKQKHFKGNYIGFYAGAIHDRILLC